MEQGVNPGENRSYIMKPSIHPTAPSDYSIGTKNASLQDATLSFQYEKNSPEQQHYRPINYPIQGVVHGSFDKYQQARQGAWVENTHLNYARYVKDGEGVQSIPVPNFSNVPANFEAFRTTKPLINPHHKQINDIVEPMIPISHHNLHINSTASLYNHERLPILVPNPHYVKPQHTTTDLHYKTSSPQVSYYTQSNNSTANAQHNPDVNKTGSPHAHQFLTQEKDFSMSSPHSSTHSNSPVAVKTKPTRGNRSYQCPKCTKVFRRGDHLKRHLLSVHDHEHPYQCGDCGKGFANVTTLSKHAKSLHSEGTSKGHLCLRCKVSFTSPVELESHASSLHVQEDQEYMQNINCSSKQHACSYCSKSFTSIANVKRHIQLLHKTKTNLKLVCETCGKKFTRSDSLRKHKEREHKGENIAPFVEKSSVPDEGSNELLRQQKDKDIKEPIKDAEVQIINSMKTAPKRENGISKPHLPEKGTKVPLISEKSPQISVPKTTFSVVPNRSKSSEKSDVSLEPTKALTVSEAVSNAMKTLSAFAHDQFYTESSPFENNFNSDSFIYYEHTPAMSAHDEQIPGSFLTLAPPPVPKKLATVQDLNSLISKRGILKAHNNNTRVGGGERPSQNIYFKYNLNAKKKEKSILNSGELYCRACDILYKTIDDLMHHFENVHLKLKPNICCICKKHFAQAGNVKRHIRFVHLQERPFKCTQCESTFDRICYLQKHQLTHSLKTGKTNKRISKTTCRNESCHSRPTVSDVRNSIGKLSKKIESEYHHSRARNNTGKTTQLKKIRHKNFVLLPFKCKSCHKSFSSLAYLKSHLKLSHNYKKLQNFCQKCGRGFSTWQLMKKHMTEHKYTLAMKKIKKSSGNKVAFSVIKYTSPSCYIPVHSASTTMTSTPLAVF